jgi:hypothetical protein
MYGTRQAEEKKLFFPIFLSVLLAFFSSPSLTLSHSLSLSLLKVYFFPKHFAGQMEKKGLSNTAQKYPQMI